MHDQNVRNPPQLLDLVRRKIRLKHYALSTERSYVNWAESFLRFHKDRNHGIWQHPREMGKAELESFLTWLAVACHVSPAQTTRGFKVKTKQKTDAFHHNRVRKAQSRVHLRRHTIENDHAMDCVVVF